MTLQEEIQVVFNKIIAAKFYPNNEENKESDNYMCNAVFNAFKRNVITVDEAVVVRKTINELIGHNNTLYNFLSLRGIKQTVQVRLECYENGYARPWEDFKFTST